MEQATAAKQEEAVEERARQAISDALNAEGYTSREQVVGCIMAKYTLAMARADAEMPLIRHAMLAKIAESFGELLSVLADEMKIDEAGQQRLVDAARKVEVLVTEHAAEIIGARRCQQSHES